tara:strand:+ start:2120 stop:3001 length:882 start_codon:yes stop_codon:yes gene_type:complete
MVYKLIYLLLLLSIGFSEWIQNPSPILTRPFDAKSAALGGINSFELNEIPSVQFSYSSSEENLFEESSILYQKGKRTYYLSYFGVPNLDNTINAWSDNGDGEPTSDEIDYTRITSFNYRSISFTYPVELDISNLEIWPTFSILSLYEESAYAAGFSISKRLNYKNSNILFFVHDVVSSKWWSTNRKEMYKPFLEIMVNSKFKKTTIFLDGILKSNEFKANIGASFHMHKNLILRGGYRSNGGFTFGAGVKLNFIELDMAFLLSDNSHPFKPNQQFTLRLLVDKALSASKRLSP